MRYPALIMRKLLALKVSLLGFICFFCAHLQVAHGQVRVVGKVFDEQTQKPIAQASVKVVGTSIGTSCDSLGNFVLQFPKESPFQLLVSAIGYTDQRIRYHTGDKAFQIQLTPNNQMIDAVSVSIKQKYNNRNPAVSLIEEVIRHKRINRMEKLPKHQYEQYDKMRFGLINPSQGYKKGLGSMAFFFENLDTVSLPGNKVLNILMKEELSDVYSNNDPVATKRIVKSVQQTDFDERYVNNHNIQSFLSYLIQDPDIYAENIFLINKLFLSPIANSAPVFYKYYIADTVDTDLGRLVELNFEPRNKADLLLHGKLWVSMDGRYAVAKAQLKANKEANLNWVNSIQIDLRFIANKEQQLFLDQSEIQVLFGTNKKESVYGHKIRINSHFDFNPTFDEGILAGPDVQVLPTAKIRGALLDERRPIALLPTEEMAYTNMEKLNQNKTFKTWMTIGYLIGQGYYNVGLFELGPLEYLYSKNNIEGNRIRVGGRTTPMLSDKFYLESYVAYGTDDKDLKYYVKPTFSLNGESIMTFPAHYLQLAVQHDIFDPGRNLGFRKGDSFFQSIRSNKPTKWLDTYAYTATHLIEFGNHVSFQSGFTHQRRRAIGDLQFISSGDPTIHLQHINTNELEFVLRWAPNEKFYYRNLTRNPIIEKNPVLSLQYRRGLSGFWDGDYRYDVLNAAVTQRLFLSQLGFADMTLSGGKIWGTLPYPLLEIPAQYQEENRHVVDYFLMRSMEFVADSYLRLSIDHRLEGFIFNKIPWVKKFRLRESWGLRMFYGSLSDRNNPYRSAEVVQFDVDKDGNRLTHVLGDKPYWEAKVGLDNILRIFRVEYVRRLNYLDLPQAKKDSYRLSVHLNF